MEQDFNNEKVISKTRNEKIKENLELFDQNSDDFDLDKKSFADLTEKVIPISKDVNDRLMSINNIIETSVLTLSGYVKEVTKDKMVFKQKKLPLTKNSIISHFEAILEAFGDPSNILAKKEWDEFRIQVESSWKAFYKFCIHSRAKPKENTRTIYREFQTCLVAIGDIVCGNPKNMEGFWNKLKKDYPEDDVGGRV